jgi:hypothetical protein
MKRLTTKILVLVVALGTAVALFSFAENSATTNSEFGAAGAEGKTGLSIDQMLTYAIQDEYLARAEYKLIIEEYGNIRPFTNIMAAEQKHIEWVTEILDRYEFTVPKDTAHRYVALPEDLQSSFQAGIQAEVDNIDMYASFLKEDLPGDVRDLFERLMRASENHLQAFRNNLSRYN